MSSSKLLTLDVEATGFRFLSFSLSTLGGSSLVKLFLSSLRCRSIKLSKIKVFNFNEIFKTHALKETNDTEMEIKKECRIYQNEIR